MAKTSQTETGIMASNRAAQKEATEKRSRGGQLDILLLKMPLAMIAAGFIIWLGYDIFGTEEEHSVQQTALVQPSVIESTLIAPVNAWSEPIRIPGSKCIRWQGADPTGHRFDVQYYDGDRKEWLTYGTGDPILRSVRFKSSTSSPETVFYQIGNKDSNVCIAIP